EHLGQAAVHVPVEDRLLVVTVLGQALDLFALDGERTLVLLDAVAVKNANLDHSSLHARRHAQRRVAHIGSLLAEDRAPQLLLRSHPALPLRPDLAPDHIPPPPPP